MTLTPAAATAPMLLFLTWAFFGVPLLSLRLIACWFFSFSSWTRFCVLLFVFTSSRVMAPSSALARKDTNASAPATAAAGGPLSTLKRSFSKSSSLLQLERDDGKFFCCLCSEQTPS